MCRLRAPVWPVVRRATAWLTWLHLVGIVFLDRGPAFDFKMALHDHEECVVVSKRVSPVLRCCYEALFAALAAGSSCCAPGYLTDLTVLATGASELRGMSST